MSFELHDTVVIFGRPREMGPPYNGMRGFIDELHGDRVCTFVALSHEDGVIKYKKLGEGGCNDIFFQPDDGEDLKDGLNAILYEREENYNKMMGAYHLKNIIEGNDE